MVREPALPGREDAEALAIAVLGFLAGRPEELQRFLDLTGLRPDSLREAAADPGFLCGVLDFVVESDSLLLSFTAERGTDPASVMEARRLLAGEPRG